MPLDLTLDHVAVLTSSIEACAARLGFPDADLGAIESFPSEGTRELYLGAGGALLLLLQPAGDGPGPYHSALAKRGPGLHHLAVNCTDLAAAVTGCGAHGWLMHPHSILSVAQSGTAWLCRPGCPTLLEVCQRPAPLPEAEACTVEQVELARAGDRAWPAGMVDIFAAGLVAPGETTRLRIGGRWHDLGAVP